MKSMLAHFAVLLAAVAAQASTLSLSIENHMAVVKVDGKQKVLRTAFTDEALVASVKLDVFAVPRLPSTRAHLDELQQLSPRTWWQELAWDVRTAAGARQQVRPRLMASPMRQRGPNARDRDPSAGVASYEASFDIGRLPPGDYSVRLSVHGLESPRFPLSVRTGQEPEVRDVYLQEQARKANEWTEFRAIELERVRLDPTKAAALVDLAHRSLESGTLEETTAYFERASKIMEQNLSDWAKVNPADAKKQAPSVQTMVTQIRALQHVLPDYFAHRKEWRVSIDPATGRYVIASRDTSKVVRAVQ